MATDTPVSKPYDAYQVAGLTAGETDAMALVAAGFKTREAGERLGLSHVAIVKRLKRARAKLAKVAVRRGRSEVAGSYFWLAEEPDEAAGRLVPKAAWDRYLAAVAAYEAARNAMNEAFDHAG